MLLLNIYEITIKFEFIRFKQFLIISPRYWRMIFMMSSVLSDLELDSVIRLWTAKILTFIFLSQIFNFENFAIFWCFKSNVSSLRRVDFFCCACLIFKNLELKFNDYKIERPCINIFEDNILNSSLIFRAIFKSSLYMM